MVTLSSSLRRVEVAERGQRRDLVGALDDRRAQSPLVVNGNVERLHQRARVLTEPLLAWHQRVAVVLVFDLTLGEVVGEADVVMRGQEQAGAFSFQPFPDGAISSGAASCFRQEWSSPKTIRVSVSARIRSSIGSL